MAGFSFDSKKLDKKIKHTKTSPSQEKPLLIDAHQTKLPIKPSIRQEKIYKAYVSSDIANSSQKNLSNADVVPEKKSTLNPLAQEWFPRQNHQIDLSTSKKKDKGKDPISTIDIAKPNRYIIQKSITDMPKSQKKFQNSLLTKLFELKTCPVFHAEDTQMKFDTISMLVKLYKNLNSSKHKIKQIKIVGSSVYNTSNLKSQDLDFHIILEGEPNIQSYEKAILMAFPFSPKFQERVKIYEGHQIIGGHYSLSDIDLTLFSEETINDSRPYVSLLDSQYVDITKFIEKLARDPNFTCLISNQDAILPDYTSSYKIDERFDKQFVIGNQLEQEIILNTKTEHISNSNRQFATIDAQNIFRPLNKFIKLCTRNNLDLLMQPFIPFLFTYKEIKTMPAGQDIDKYIQKTVTKNMLAETKRNCHENNIAYLINIYNILKNSKLLNQDLLSKYVNIITNELKTQLYNYLVSKHKASSRKGCSENEIIRLINENYKNYNINLVNFNLKEITHKFIEKKFPPQCFYLQIPKFDTNKQITKHINYVLTLMKKGDNPENNKIFKENVKQFIQYLKTVPKFNLNNPNENIKIIENVISQNFAETFDKKSDEELSCAEWEKLLIKTLIEYLDTNKNKINFLSDLNDDDNNLIYIDLYLDTLKTSKNISKLKNLIPNIQQFLNKNYSEKSKDKIFDFLDLILQKKLIKPDELPPNLLMDFFTNLDITKKSNEMLLQNNIAYIPEIYLKKIMLEYFNKSSKKVDLLKILLKYKLNFALANLEDYLKLMSHQEIVFALQKFQNKKLLIPILKNLINQQSEASIGLFEILIDVDDMNLSFSNIKYEDIFAFSSKKHKETDSAYKLYLIFKTIKGYSKKSYFQKFLAQYFFQIYAQMRYVEETRSITEKFYQLNSKIFFETILSNSDILRNYLITIEHNITDTQKDIIYHSFYNFMNFINDKFSNSSDDMTDYKNTINHILTEKHLDILTNTIVKLFYDDVEKVLKLPLDNMGNDFLLELYLNIVVKLRIFENFRIFTQQAFSPFIRKYVDANFKILATNPDPKIKNLIFDLLTSLLVKIFILKAYTNSSEDFKEILEYIDTATLNLFTKTAWRPDAEEWLFYKFLLKILKTESFDKKLLTDIKLKNKFTSIFNLLNPHMPNNSKGIANFLYSVKNLLQNSYYLEIEELHNNPDSFNFDALIFYMKIAKSLNSIPNDIKKDFLKSLYSDFAEILNVYDICLKKAIFNFQKPLEEFQKQLPTAFSLIALGTNMENIPTQDFSSIINILKTKKVPIGANQISILDHFLPILFKGLNHSYTNFFEPRITQKEKLEIIKQLIINTKQIYNDPILKKIKTRILNEYKKLILTIEPSMESEDYALYMDIEDLLR